jgi:hypothetical protein
LTIRVKFDSPTGEFLLSSSVNRADEFLKYLSRIKSHTRPISKRNSLYKVRVYIGRKRVEFLKYNDKENYRYLLSLLYRFVLELR